MSGLLRLRHFPSVLAAVAAAAAVLAVAAASAAPFLSAAANAAYAQERGLVGPERAGLTVEVAGRTAPDQFLAATAALDDTLTAARAFDHRSVTAQTPTMALEAGALQVRTRVLGRTGGLEDLERDGDPDAAGVWLAASMAEAAGLSAGDVVQFSVGDRTAEVPVAGTYRGLDQRPLPPVWAGLETAVLGAETRSEPPPPPALADPGTVVALAHGLRGDVNLTWSYPVPDDVAGLTQARRAQARYATIARTATDSRTDLGRILGAAERGIARAPSVDSEMTSVVMAARRSVDALAGPVTVLALAGQAVAATMMGTAAYFALRRRRAETRLLAVRGIGPLTQGAQAVWECLLPTAFGVLVGWQTALWLVGWFGPPGELAPGTPAAALGQAALAGGAALLLVGAVTAATVLAETRTTARRRSRAWSKAPWEAAVLIMAAVALVQLRSQGAIVLGGSEPARIDPLALAFPLLFISGCAGLVSRAAGRLLPALRARGASWPAWSFVALRRLASAPAALLVVATAATLAAGIFAYAATLGASSRETVVSKAAVSIGAATVVDVAPDAAPPAVSEVPTSLVGRTTGRLQPSGETVDVLLVDPDTLADAAFWRSRFADASLPSLMSSIGEAGGDRLPGLVAGGVLPDGAVLQLEGVGLPLAAGPAVETFPGQSAARPLLVLAADAVRAATDRVWPAASRQLWIADEHASALAELQAAGVPEESVTRLSDVAGQPRLVSVSWALGYLQALGTLAGLLALTGLLVQAQSRQQARQVSYALAVRMGMRPSAHRRALRAELGGVLVLALAVGTILAVCAAALVSGSLDPLPHLSPGPVLRVPVVPLAGAAMVVVAASWAGAAWLQSVADRADPGEVLRRVD